MDVWTCPIKGESFQLLIQHLRAFCYRFTKKMWFVRTAQACLTHVHRWICSRKIPEIALLGSRSATRDTKSSLSHVSPNSFVFTSNTRCVVTYSIAYFECDSFRLVVTRYMQWQARSWSRIALKNWMGRSMWRRTASASCLNKLSSSNSAWDLSVRRQSSIIVPIATTG